MDTRQLALITEDSPGRDWRLDDHTREVGRRGIAAARAALRSSPRHRDLSPSLAFDERSADHGPPAAA